MKKLLFLSLLFPVAINTMETNNTQFPQKVINRAQQTNIFDACRIDDIELVKYFIATGADVNETDRFGRTPLLIAAEKGRQKICQLLLNHGADVDKATPENPTPLYWAACYQNIDLCKLFLEHDADVNKVNKRNGQTPLYCAAITNNTKIFLLLLKYGADVNPTDKRICSPLIGASQHGYTNIVRLLLIHGADINQTRNVGWSALHFASLWGYTDIVRLLLQSEEAQVNKTTIDDGWSALHLASRKGHTDIIKLLLANRANPFITTSTPMKLSSLDVAQNNQIRKLILETYAAKHTSQNQKDRVYTLIAINDLGKNLPALPKNVIKLICLDHLLNKKHTFNIREIIQENVKDPYKQEELLELFPETDLIKACQNGDTEVAKYLIANGANVNETDNYGQTPLFWSARRNNTELCQFLVQHDADPNKANEFGNTLLHKAVKMGHLTACQQLIASGADVNQIDNRGYSPLQMASTLELAKLLLHSGAQLNHTKSKGECILRAACRSGEVNLIKLGSVDFSK